MKKRIPGAARDAPVKLFAIDQLLLESRDQYMQLADRVPYGRMHVGNILARTDKLVDAILETIPDDQKMTLYRQMKISEIRVSVQGPQGRKYDDYWVMSRDDMLDLIRLAIWGSCPECTDTDGSKCPLRKIIDEGPVEVDTIVMGCKGGVI